MQHLRLLSHTLCERTPLYGGKKEIRILPVQAIAKGDASNTMFWALPNHAGTHVDAPRHFVKNGLPVDRLPVDNWIFNKVVLKIIRGVEPGRILSERDIGKLPRSTDILLLKTGFERRRGQKVYWQDSPALQPSLAGWLKKQCPKLRAVGMDFISVSNIHNRELGRAAHRGFLGRRIILVEDMRLSGLRQDPKKILVAPLMVKDSDGAPCTVFAWEK